MVDLKLICIRILSSMPQPRPRPRAQENACAAPFISSLLLWRLLPLRELPQLAWWWFCWWLWLLLALLLLLIVWWLCCWRLWLLMVLLPMLIEFPQLELLVA